MYANRWRFRSTHNLVYNAVFIYNNGSLDSNNELMRQMQQVVLTYKVIGVKIFGVVLDAGGGEIKMCKLLQGRHVVKRHFPDAKCLSFAIPVDK